MAFLLFHIILFYLTLPSLFFYARLSFILLSLILNLAPASFYFNFFPPPFFYSFYPQKARFKKPRIEPFKNIFVLKIFLAEVSLSAIAKAPSYQLQTPVSSILEFGSSDSLGGKKRIS